MVSINKFIFSTPVWGEKYVGLFLDVGLPSLLAPGNLPDLARISSCKYLIYTTDADRDRIRSSTIWGKLEAVMPVEFCSLGKETPIQDPYRAMSDCQFDTMQRADAAGAAAVFPSPDMVWGRGGLVRLDAIARSGKSAVFMSAIRLDRDAVVPLLIERRSADGAVLDMSPRELVKLGLGNLHKVALSHYWKEYDTCLLPPNLYWSVPGEGLTARCFHLHPLMVKSQRKNAAFAGTIDDDLVPNACPDARRDYIVSDSDELIAFEMSGPERIIETQFQKASLTDLRVWLEVGANERHRRIGRAAIRIHHAPMTAATWKPVDAEADEIIRRGLSTAEASSLALFVRDRRLLAWRSLALLDGRGRYAGKASPILRLTATGLRNLLASYGNLRRALFMKAGAPRFSHPIWPVRHAIANKLRVTLRADQGYDLIAESPRFATHVCSALPDLDIIVMGDTTETAAALSARPAMDHAACGRSLIVVGDVAPLKIAADRPYRAIYNVTLGGRASPGDNRVPVSALGAKLSWRLWRLISYFRANYFSGSARLMLMPIYLVLGPVFIIAAAAVGAMTNSGLSALDYVGRRT